MADVLMSGIGVTALSGSIGNTTFSFNAFGQYAKAKPGTPAGSAYLTAWNALVSIIIQMWQTGMTDAQRLEWYKFELNHKDELAFRHRITGFYSFMSCNCNISIAGGVNITAPPPYVLPRCFDSLNQVGSIDMEIVSSVPTKVAIYATKLLPAGRMSVNQIYAYLTYALINPGINPQGLAPLWTARFGGAPPPPGQKVFYKVQPLDDRTGLRNVEKYLMCNT